jgi:site-specific DNA-methyltransferase (adenine-specific)
MPKRPPRLREELRAPADLARARPPHRAHATELGTLWLADCLDFLASLPAGSARLVFADPPYAIAKDEWDEFESLDAYAAWCDRWLAAVHRVLADDGTAYVCGFSEILAELKARSARRFAACRWLVWTYRNKANLGGDWGRSHESLLHLRKGRRFVMNVDDVRVPYNDHTRRYPERAQAVTSQYGGGKPRADRWAPHPLGAKPRDVLEIPVICNGMAEKTAHPTQKPEELLRRLILASSHAGDLVVDPFCGSGTTAIVAERLGRRWAAADADPRYVGLARARLTSSGSPRRRTAAR